jgi:hypothetical protein
MYQHGIGRISNCLTRLLHYVLGCASATNLKIFFCAVKIFPLLEVLFPRTIPYVITE